MQTLTDLRKEAISEIVVDEILNAEAGSVELCAIEQFYN